MSLDATRWAWRQGDIRPMQKLVLLSLADRADADNCCFPSHAMLIADTGMDNKTIWTALKELAGLGLITDTGRRAGKTRQVTVWQLNGVETRDFHVKTEGFQKRKDSVFPEKGFQKRNTEPTKEPTNTNNNNARASQTDDKQPVGASTGGEGTHNSEQAKPVERAKPKHRLPESWRPDQRCWELVEIAGIDRGFAESLLDEFRMYWLDRGDKRPGWNSTFLKHAKAQWKRQTQNGPTAASPAPGQLSSTNRNRGTNYVKPSDIAARIAHIAIHGLPPVLNEPDAKGSVGVLGLEHDLFAQMG